MNPPYIRLQGDQYRLVRKGDSVELIDDSRCMTEGD